MLQGKILHQERDGRDRRDKDVLKTRPQHRVRTQEFNGPTVWSASYRRHMVTLQRSTAEKMYAPTGTASPITTKVSPLEPAHSKTS